jgi:hypothetical protein
MGANGKMSFCEKNKAENKPWFDMKCREKKQGFHRCKKKLQSKTKLIHSPAIHSNS